MKTNRQQILQICGKDQIFRNDSTKSLFKVSLLMECYATALTLNMGADRLPQNFGNQLPINVV